MADDEAIILFYTMTEVFKAEKALKRRGIEVKIVPVPRELSSDCGISVSIAAQEREQARQILDDAGVEYSGIHQAR